MSKTFKVVCIDNKGAIKLEIGKVYDAAFGDSQTTLKVGHDSYFNIAMRKSLFLRLPTEPKTCADMTMEEWLAISAVLVGPDNGLVEYDRAGWGFTQSSSYFLHRTLCANLYRIKPDNPNSDAIARIEKEMCNLADELASLKDNRCL